MNAPILTARDLEDLACLEKPHFNTASLRIEADDRRTYFFAVSHYLDGVLEGNPDPEATGARERLVLRFTTGEVTILGFGLNRIENRLAEGGLRGLKTV